MSNNEQFYKLHFFVLLNSIIKFSNDYNGAEHKEQAISDFFTWLIEWVDKVLLEIDSLEEYK